MPTYFVKTRAEANPETDELVSRSLSIEADSFEYFNGNYDFFKSGGNKKARILVASVPSRDVFTVIGDEAYQADYFYYPEDYDDLEEDDFEDLCDECREALNAEDTPPEAIQPAPVPQTPTAVPDARDESYPIEKWWTKDGDIQYGFPTPKGFVNCYSEDFAKTCRGVHRDDPGQTWSYLDLTGATKLEENL